MAKESKQSTSITTNNGKLDLMNLGQKDVAPLLEKVNEQIQKLKGNLPNEAKTTGELFGFGKISEIESVEKLVTAHSYVTNKARVYKESANELGVDIKKYPFKLDGSSEGAWVNDIKMRVGVVANKVQLEKLEKVKKELEDNLSAEDKLKKSLANIASIIDE